MLEVCVAEHALPEEQMTKRDMLEKFGVTNEQLEAWEEEAAQGSLRGKPTGPVIKGRPLLFGEEMKQVGFKEPLAVIDAMQKRAEQLGMSRSGYLRHLVEQDLRSAGLIEDGSL